jgi:hypothetical protein
MEAQFRKVKLGKGERRRGKKGCQVFLFEILGIFFLEVSEK